MRSGRGILSLPVRAPFLRYTIGRVAVLLNCRFELWCDRQVPHGLSLSDRMLAESTIRNGRLEHRVGALPVRPKTRVTAETPL